MTDRARFLPLRLAPCCRRTRCTKAKAPDSTRSLSTRTNGGAILDPLFRLFLPTTMSPGRCNESSRATPIGCGLATIPTGPSISLFWHAEIRVTWFQAFNPIIGYSPSTPSSSRSGHGRRSAEWSRRPSPRWRSLPSASPCLSDHGSAAWSAGGNSATWWWLFSYVVRLTIASSISPPSAYRWFRRLRQRA